MSGELVLVATPIGNLGDMSARGLEALRNADVIACEDTRHTRKLLTHFSISGPKLIAVHEHNELQVTTEIVERVGRGEKVALVSDAGMPAVSDPGEMVVRGVTDAGLAVSVVPGASAVLGALVISGLATERFCFEGFLPRKPSDRRKTLQGLADEERTLVFYESPHRIAASIADLAAIFGADRRVALVRELTKIHEEVRRCTLGELADQLEGHTTKGECVVVVEGATPVNEAVDEATVESALRARIDAGESKKDAASAVAEQFKLPRRAVYEQATKL